MSKNNHTYSYYVPSLSEGIDDTVPFVSTWGIDNLDYVAGDIAEELYHDRDGWEYMPDNELQIAIVINPDDIRYYTITTEFEPTFDVQEKNTQ